MKRILVFVLIVGALRLAAAPFKVDGTAVTFLQQGNSAVFLLEFE